MKEEVQEISFIEFVWDVLIYCVHLPAAGIAGLITLILVAINLITGIDLVRFSTISFIIALANIIIFVFAYILDVVLMERREDYEAADN